MARRAIPALLTDNAAPERIPANRAQVTEAVARLGVPAARLPSV